MTGKNGARGLTDAEASRLRDLWAEIERLRLLRAKLYRGDQGGGGRGNGVADQAADDMNHHLREARLLMDRGASS